MSQKKESAAKTKRRKPKQTQKTTSTAELEAPFDPTQLVSVCGCLGQNGIAESEYGPSVDIVRPFPNSGPLCRTDVLGVGVCQMTDHGYRWMIKSQFRAVFVFSREDLIDSDRHFTAKLFSTGAGSFTEAKSAVQNVKWIPLFHDVKVSSLARIAAGELRIAFKENPKLRPSEVMIIIWKDSREAFEGRSLEEIGSAVRDETFTANDVRIAEAKRAAPFKTTDDDDDFDPSDWWKSQ
eukprot:TRINITY_DN81943_c0_g1_i1.p1 TRINITY_DN81943_c0_g1~~TRINITY_DN81943_c0_g1_i1.p1  ORF type:complete len:237 (+),score=26.08 TRINITY_DN81943_c0_g1_i1:170-880(+)